MIDMSLRPPPERLELVARAGLASLMAVACADGTPNDRAIAFIRAVRDRLLRVDVNIDDLDPLTPDQLARAVPEPQWRERILRGMTVLALMEGPATRAELRILDATASALELDPAPVETFRKVVDDKTMAVRLDIARRSFLRPAIGAYLKIEGARGALGVAMELLRKEDAATAARYHELDNYPEATFGRAFADFIRINRFQYPGEVGGPPAPAMRHDCCHVLGGYGTTASEECAVLAFQAGFQKEDPFFVMLFSIAQFELGIRVSPLLPGAELPIDPDLVIAGLEHGSHVNRDIVGDASWDPWDHFETPIEDLRTALNVLPRGRDPEYLRYDEDGNIEVTV